MSKPIPVYHLYGEQTAPPADFWLHCETIPSRSQLHHYDISTHRHQHLAQLLFVSQGTADAKFERRIVRVEPPALILVPAGSSHGFHFSKDIDGLVITMLASHAGLMQRELNHTPQVLDLSGDQAHCTLIKHLLGQIATECSTDQFGRSEMLASSLSMVLLLSIRAIKTKTDDAPPLRDGLRISKFTSLLQQHLLQQHSASFYAAKLSITPTHLNRLSQSHFGKSTRDYIASVLITQIKRDLLFTHDPIQSLSYRFGFSDPAYFSRFFRKMEKTTPAKWREHERRGHQPVDQSST